jgi:hypothetical protein
MSQRPGDTVDLINRSATAVPKSRIPKLLLYGTLGMVVRQRAVVVARAQIALTRQETGAIEAPRRGRKTAVAIKSMDHASLAVFASPRVHRIIPAGVDARMENF